MAARAKPGNKAGARGTSARAAGTALFRRILCPIDFEHASMAALDLAVALARRTAATIHLLNVAPSPLGESRTAPIRLEPYRFREDMARSRLDEIARARVAGRARFETSVAQGDPATEVLSAIMRGGVDLVVLGTHGRTGVRRLLLGSVAEKVVRESPVPVLTVRPDAWPASRKGRRG
jgi:nucleotide-binding universal stress UspA family protein